MALKGYLTAVGPRSRQAQRGRVTRALSGPRFEERLSQGRGDETGPTVLLLAGETWRGRCRGEESSGLVRETRRLG